MEDEELGKYVWLATWKDYKRLSCDDFRHCDYADDLSEVQRHQVYDLEDELRAIGRNAFVEKYKRFKMFP